MQPFTHPSQSLQKDKPLIYTAFSKQLFYYRMFVSKFVLEQNGVPLNPFMVFDYFLLDSIERDIVREANNNLVKKSEEVWVFGPISDGVWAEIELAKSNHKPLRYFKIENQVISECSAHDMIFEEGFSNPPTLT